MCHFHLGLTHQGTNQLSGKWASDCAYTRDHAREGSSGKGGQPLGQGPYKLGNLSDSPTNPPEELVGLVLVFAQARFAEYLADLLFAFQFGIAVRITIMAGLRIAVMAQLILELELGIAVVARFWITVVSRFVSNWCFKHCHGETSLSLHFQEFTFGRG